LEGGLNLYKYGSNPVGWIGLKREVDITSGALRKAGMPASRVKALKNKPKSFIAALEAVRECRDEYL